MLKGSIVALITPFIDEKLSESEYIKLINYHLMALSQARVGKLQQEANQASTDQILSQKALPI